MPRRAAVKQEIVTIDGPSGSGKSTISRMLAARLGYAYLDTGAMYRAAGLAAMRAGIPLDDEEKIAALLDSAFDLELLPGADDTRVLLGGEDVSREIRTAEMGLVASKVSALPAVRQRLGALQREIGGRGRVVCEGRDMGTVVFPDAAWKFFLDATPEERARRRTAQLIEKGENADYDAILAQIKKRDHDDSSRAVAPLRPAPDAVVIDSSRMNADEVVSLMLKRIRAAV